MAIENTNNYDEERVPPLASNVPEKVEENIRRVNDWLRYKDFKLRVRREEIFVDGEWLKYYSCKMKNIPYYVETPDETKLREMSELMIKENQEEELKECERVLKERGIEMKELGREITPEFSFLKICSSCCEKKESREFRLCKTSEDGLQSKCKECIKK